MRYLQERWNSKVVTFSISLAMLCLTQPGISRAENQVPTTTQGAMVAYWLTFVIITVFLGLAFLLVRKALISSSWWSLADALSEEAGNQGVLPVGQRPEMVASSSRLIALLGLLVLLALFLGVGYSILWALYTGNSLPNISDLTSFFLSGLALFSPYAFNQVKEAFTAFGASSPMHSSSRLSVTALSPNTGPSTGGTLVTITGAGFMAGARVSFGGTSVSPAGLNSTSISVTTPQHPSGLVDIVVTNPDGQSITPATGFTYV